MPWTAPCETDRAWMAGFYSGEGSLSWGRESLSLTVVQVDREPLERLSRIMQFGYLADRQPTGVGTQVTGTWKVHRYDQILQCLAVMWPWLIPSKKQQAKVAIEKFRRLRNTPPGMRRVDQKLTLAQVEDIRRRLAAGEVQARIAERYGVSQSCVWRIKSGRNWGHPRFRSM